MTPKTRNTLLGLGGLLIIAAGSAGYAVAHNGADGGQKHGHMRGQMMQHMQTMMDIDGDGNITRDEITAHKTEFATEADTNKDGILSADEVLEAHQKRHMQMRMTRLDTNDDGQVTIEEFTKGDMGRIDRMFKKLDKDEDGILSSQELAKMKRGEHHGDMTGHGSE